MLDLCGLWCSMIHLYSGILWIVKLLWQSVQTLKTGSHILVCNRKIFHSFFNPNIMLWVLKRLSSMRQFFWVPITHVYLLMHKIRVCTGLKSSWIYRTVLKSPWKLNLACKVLEKHSKALKSPWVLPFTGGFNSVFGDLNQYKIVIPLFGAASWWASAELPQNRVNINLSLRHIRDLSR